MVEVDFDDQKSSRRKKKEPVELTPREKLKMEIAAELGLLERVEQEGWESLTLAECGRVGGILAQRMKELNLS